MFVAFLKSFACFPSCISRPILKVITGTSSSSRCLIFKVLSASLPRSVLYILSRFRASVKHFFLLFFGSFSDFLPLSRFSVSFFRLSRRLDYNTTPASPCQRVFSFFLRVFDICQNYPNFCPVSPFFPPDFPEPEEEGRLFL